MTPSKRMTYSDFLFPERNVQCAICKARTQYRTADPDGTFWCTTCGKFTIYREIP